MADMNFKANLLPNTDLGYNLGSSNKRWKFTGDGSGITGISTQGLSRPKNLNGTNDVTVQTLINDNRANRLAFLPADQIIIEKTTDGGTTWTDAGIADSVKIGLFSQVRPVINIPLLNGNKDTKCGLRITITAMKYNVPAGTAETAKYNYWNSNYVTAQERYNQLKEMYFWVNSNNDAIKVKVERATGATSTTWSTCFENNNYAMNGWSGNDYISFPQGVFGGGTNQTTNWWNYRITLFTSGPSGGALTGNGPTNQQSIMEIRGYGDTWWNAGNTMAAKDHLYDWNYEKSAYFPYWINTAGVSGWANNTYGGGWYMSDNTWIRSYGNKSIYHNTGTLRTDGTLQVGADGKYTSISSSGIKLGDTTATSNGANLITVNGHMVINAAKNTANSWSEGLRINNGSNNWSSLVLGGDDTSTSGTSKSTWSLHTYRNDTTNKVSQFYLSYNGSNNATTRITGHADNNGGIGWSIRPRLGIGQDPDTDYALAITGSGKFTGTTTASKFIGPLEVTHVAGQCNEIAVKYGSTIDYWWGVGTGNENHGLYDSKISKWVILAGSDNVWTFDGNAASSTAVKDYNNGTLTKFGYSTSGMASTSWLGSWDGYNLRAISPANAIKSGIGTTAIGAAGTPIYWDGSKFVAGNAAATSGHNHDSTYVKKSGDTMSATLNIKPATGEGGELHLEASTASTTSSGIILDNYYGSFRIFGIASADGSTRTGTGTPLVIDPYTKTITGGYTITGNLSGNADSASKLGSTTVGSNVKPIYLSNGSPTAGEEVIPLYRTAVDFTATTPAPGAYYLDNATNPVTNASEYGTVLTLPWRKTGTSNYSSQMLISSPSGTGQPHMYIRRNTSTPALGNWSTILDNSNYTSYTVKKDGTGASGTWGISITGNANTATTAGRAVYSASAGYAVDTTRVVCLGRKTTAAQIAFNPSTTEGNGRLTWHISDSSSRSNDATNSPSYDCAILNLPWDWGAYNGQIAVGNTGTARMQIRAASHVDNGESANPRYTPNYGSWREVVTAPKATAVGSATQPVYINETGQVVAGNSFSSYLPLSGGTLSGALNTANNTWNKIGDDAQLGDINSAGKIGIQGINGNTGIFFTTYNQTNKLTGGGITWDGGKFVLTGTAPTLGSSTIGNYLNPIYLNGGTVTASAGNTIPYIVGTGSTAGTWLGTLTGLTAYTDGLLILYKTPIAGASTTTLNLNDLGAKTIYRQSSTKLTTHYVANSTILLVYSTSLNSGCWMVVDDYDSNSNTLLRTYAGNANNEYPLLAQNSSANATSAWTEYTTGSKDYYGVIPNSSTTRATINLSSGKITVPGGIVGDLTGNASSATKATQDSDGNAINSTYLKLSGGTMTGQIKTSFKSSVVPGLYNSSQTTIPNLIEEVRYSSGCAGSFNLTTAYTLNNITVPTAWYNFIYIPHRSGGINGTASGDNCNYGILYLHCMTAPTYGDFKISFVSSAINLARMDAQFTAAPTTGQVIITDGTQGGIKSSGFTIAKSVPSNAVFTDTDTKNTAGSTQSTSKIYVIGATSQAANPQTYSNTAAYVNDGQVNGKSIRVQEKVTLQFNSTTNALDFVFA